MSPRILRRIVWLVFIAGIAGMIVGSIKESSGGAITAGIVTAIAAAGLILITAVAPPGSLAKPTVVADDESLGAGAGPPGAALVDERLALDVEQRINELVRQGADEDEVRSLVARAVDLGRGARRTTSA
jgi:hypothetical protein